MLANMKSIALYRTSTDAQEVESQRKEIIEFAISDGCNPSDIIEIGCAGASAIKLDQQYLDNINEVYRTIESENVGCVYAWDIDRIGRNEVVLMEFKNFLIKHRVNLKVRSLSVSLFDRNGNVDAGFELVYSFFGTLAKQEMEQKQARFERARKRNMEAGKYIGGYVALGYNVGDNGYFEIDEREAELVRLIYSEFNTGKYSTTTLAREMNQRGYTSKGNIPFCSTIISRVLNYKAYTGEVIDKKGRRKTFPVIVSKQEQARAKEILDTNNTRQTKAIKHYYFGNKLIVCPDCGHHFVVLNNCYQCTGAILAKREGTGYLCDCTNNIAITFRNLDGILWEIAKREVIAFIEGDQSEVEKETKDKIAVLDQKINTLRNKLAQYEQKIEDIIDNGDRMMLSEAQIMKRVGNVRKMQEGEANELRAMEAERARLHHTLNFSEVAKKWLTGYGSISDIELQGDEKVMYDLVHQYIDKVTVERSEYNGNSNFQLVTVEAKSGVYKVWYNGRKKVGDKAFASYPDQEGEFVFNFNQIIRTDNGVTTAENEMFREFDGLLKSLGDIDNIWDNPLTKKCAAANEQRTIQMINQVALL